MSEAPKVMHLAYHPACDCKVAYQNIPERTGIDKSDGRALVWAKFHHDDTVTALQEQNRDFREALEAIERGDDSLDGMQGDIARGALEANKQETDT